MEVRKGREAVLSFVSEWLVSRRDCGGSVPPRLVVRATAYLIAPAAKTGRGSLWRLAFNASSAVRA